MANPSQLPCIIAFSTLLVGCSSPSNPSSPSSTTLPPETTTHTVISTGDGDTLKVQSQEGQAITVRIGCVDSPEYRQGYGPEASQRLKMLLSRGTTIELREIDVDQYGRTVGEVYSKGQSVGLTLVKEGYAVVYKQYLDGCSNTADQYLSAEEDARSQRLNFWSQSDPIMPWDFRRGER